MIFYLHKFRKNQRHRITLLFSTITILSPGYACLRITCERISFADSCSICEEEKEGRMVRVARIRRQYRDTIVEIIGAVPSLCLLPDYREGKERGENGRDR